MSLDRSAKIRHVNGIALNELGETCGMYTFHHEVREMVALQNDNTTLQQLQQERLCPLSQGGDWGGGEEGEGGAGGVYLAAKRAKHTKSEPS